MCNEKCNEDDTFLNFCTFFENFGPFWKFIFGFVLEKFGFFLFGHDYYSEIMLDNFGIMIESLIECSSDC